MRGVEGEETVALEDLKTYEADENLLYAAGMTNFLEGLKAAGDDDVKRLVVFNELFVAYARVYQSSEYGNNWIMRRGEEGEPQVDLKTTQVDEAFDAIQKCFDPKTELATFIFGQKLIPGEVSYVGVAGILDYLGLQSKEVDGELIFIREDTGEPVLLSEWVDKVDAIYHMPEFQAVKNDETVRTILNIGAAQGVLIGWTKMAVNGDDGKIWFDLSDTSEDPTMASSLVVLRALAHLKSAQYILVEADAEMVELAKAVEENQMAEDLKGYVPDGEVAGFKKGTKEISAEEVLNMMIIVGRDVTFRDWLGIPDSYTILGILTDSENSVFADRLWYFATEAKTLIDQWNRDCGGNWTIEEIIDKVAVIENDKGVQELAKKQWKRKNGLDKNDNDDFGMLMYFARRKEALGFAVYDQPQWSLAVEAYSGIGSKDFRKTDELEADRTVLEAEMPEIKARYSILFGNNIIGYFGNLMALEKIGGIASGPLAPRNDGAGTDVKEISSLEEMKEMMVNNLGELIGHEGRVESMESKLKWPKGNYGAGITGARQVLGSTQEFIHDPKLPKESKSDTEIIVEEAFTSTTLNALKPLEDAARSRTKDEKSETAEVQFPATDVSVSEAEKPAKITQRQEYINELVNRGLEFERLIAKTIGLAPGTRIMLSPELYEELKKTPDIIFEIFGKHEKPELKEKPSLIEKVKGVFVQHQPLKLGKTPEGMKNFSGIAEQAAAARFDAAWKRVPKKLRWKPDLYILKHLRYLEWNFNTRFEYDFARESYNGSVQLSFDWSRARSEEEKLAMTNARIAEKEYIETLRYIANEKERVKSEYLRIKGEKARSGIRKNNAGLRKTQWEDLHAKFKVEKSWEAEQNKWKLDKACLDFDEASANLEIINAEFIKARLALKHWGLDEEELAGRTLEDDVYEILQIGAMDSLTLAKAVMPIKLGKESQEIVKAAQEGQIFKGQAWYTPDVQLSLYHMVSQLLAFRGFGDDGKSEKVGEKFSLAWTLIDPSRDEKATVARRNIIHRGMSYSLAERFLFEEIRDKYAIFGKAVNALSAAEKALKEAEAEEKVTSSFDKYNASTDVEWKKSNVASAQQNVVLSWINFMDTMGLRADQVDLLQKIRSEPKAKVRSDEEVWGQKFTIVRMKTEKSGWKKFTEWGFRTEPALEYTCQVFHEMPDGSRVYMDVSGDKQGYSYCEINDRTYRIVYNQDEAEKDKGWYEVCEIFDGEVRGAFISRNGKVRLGGELNKVNASDLFMVKASSYAEQAKVPGQSRWAFDFSIGYDLEELKKFNPASLSLGVPLPRGLKPLVNAGAMGYFGFAGAVPGPVVVLGVALGFYSYARAEKQREDIKEDYTIRAGTEGKKSVTAFLQEHKSIDLAEQELANAQRVYQDIARLTEDRWQHAADLEKEVFPESGKLATRPVADLYRARRVLAEYENQLANAGISFQRAREKKDFVAVLTEDYPKIGTATIFEKVKDEAKMVAVPILGSEEEIDAQGKVEYEPLFQKLARPNAGALFQLDIFGLDVLKEEHLKTNLARTSVGFYLPLNLAFNTGYNAAQTVIDTTREKAEELLREQMFSAQESLNNAIYRFQLIKFIKALYSIMAKKGEVDIERITQMLFDMRQITKADIDLIVKGAKEFDIDKELEYAERDFDKAKIEVERISVKVGRPLPKGFLDELVDITRTAPIAGLPESVVVENYPEISRILKIEEEYRARAQEEGNLFVKAPYQLNSLTNDYELLIGVGAKFDAAQYLRKKYNLSEAEIAQDLFKQRVKDLKHDVNSAYKNLNERYKAKEEIRLLLVEAGKRLGEFESRHYTREVDSSNFYEAIQDYMKYLAKYTKVSQDYISADIAVRNLLERLGVDVGKDPSTRPFHGLAQDDKSAGSQDDRGVSSSVILRRAKPDEESKLRTFMGLPIADFATGEQFCKLRQQLYYNPNLPDEFAARPVKIEMIDIDTGEVKLTITCHYDLDDPKNHVVYYHDQTRNLITVFHEDTERMYLGSRFTQPDAVLEQNISTGEWEITSINAEPDREFGFTLKAPKGLPVPEGTAIGTITWDETKGRNIVSGQIPRAETVDLVRKATLDLKNKRVILTGDKIEIINEKETVTGKVVIFKDLDFYSELGYTFEIDENGNYTGIGYKTIGENKIASEGFVFEVTPDFDPEKEAMVKHDSQRLKRDLEEIKEMLSVTGFLDTRIPVTLANLDPSAVSIGKGEIIRDAIKDVESFIEKGEIGKAIEKIQIIYNSLESSTDQGKTLQNKLQVFLKKAQSLERNKKGHKSVEFVPLSRFGVKGKEIYTFYTEEKETFVKYEKVLKQAKLGKVLPGDIFVSPLKEKEAIRQVTGLTLNEKKEIGGIEKVMYRFGVRRDAGGKKRYYTQHEGASREVLRDIAKGKTDDAIKVGDVFKAPAKGDDATQQWEGLSIDESGNVSGTGNLMYTFGVRRDAGGKKRYYTQHEGASREVLRDTKKGKTEDAIKVGDVFKAPAKGDDATQQWEGLSIDESGN
ncbi:MAG: hypothetical protein ABH844_04385, partial [Candidatus Omnitrophota bacterium]